MNDLSDCVYNKIKLYADDVLLYSVIHSTADCICLQEDLNLLHQWSVLWLMDFNPVKCEFIQITNKKNPIVYQYYIGSSVINRYLTVSTWESLLMKVWHGIIASLWLSIRLDKLITLCRNFYQCESYVKCNLYKFMVQPIIKFAAPVWDSHTLLSLLRFEGV